MSTAERRATFPESSASSAAARPRFVAVGTVSISPQRQPGREGTGRGLLYGQSISEHSSWHCWGVYMPAASAVAANAVLPPSVERCRARNVLCAACMCFASFRPRSWSSSPNSNRVSSTCRPGPAFCSRHQQRASLHGAVRLGIPLDAARWAAADANYAFAVHFLGLQGSVNDEMRHSVEADRHDPLRVSAREALAALPRLPDARVRSHLACRARGAILDEHLLSVGRAPRWSAWPISFSSCFGGRRWV